MGALTVGKPLQQVAEVQAAQFGLKLGGIMLLEEGAAQANVSGSDDKEMKIPPIKKCWKKRQKIFSVGGPQRLRARQLQ